MHALNVHGVGIEDVYDAIALHYGESKVSIFGDKLRIVTGADFFIATPIIRICNQLCYSQK